MYHYLAKTLSRAPHFNLPEIETVFCFSITPTQGIYNILAASAQEKQYALL
jgi:hypothetical protein